jgi:predicted phage terminase large subunit-like protein
MTGILDVVEARIKKRLPSVIISDTIEMQRQYGCLCWSVEAVQFQEFLRTELVRQSAELGFRSGDAGHPHSDKILRIESLQPYVFNGLIRLHPSQVTLIEQLRHFPKADHDDGPMGCICSGRCVIPLGRATVSATFRAGRTMTEMMTTDIQAAPAFARVR